MACRSVPNICIIPTAITASIVYQQHLTAAIRVYPADPGESVTQIAAIQEPIRYLAEDRTPEAVLFGKAFLIHSLQLLEAVFDQDIRRLGFGVGGGVDRHRQYVLPHPSKQKDGRFARRGRMGRWFMK